MIQKYLHKETREFFYTISPSLTWFTNGTKFHKMLRFDSIVCSDFRCQIDCHFNKFLNYRKTMVSFHIFESVLLMKSKRFYFVAVGLFHILPKHIVGNLYSFKWFNLIKKTYLANGSAFKNTFFTVYTVARQPEVNEVENPVIQARQ